MCTFIINFKPYVSHHLMAVLEKEESIGNTPSSKQGLKPGFDRVTFIVKDEVAFGLKFIKTMEGGYIKDLVNDALEKFIREWEKDNGQIPQKMKAANQKNKKAK